MTKKVLILIAEFDDTVENFTCLENLVKEISQDYQAGKGDNSIGEFYGKDDKTAINYEYDFFTKNKKQEFPAMAYILKMRSFFKYVKKEDDYLVNKK